MPRMWTLDTVQKVAAVDPAVWSRIVRLMVLARKVDEQVIRLCRQGQIRGSSFTGIGQEAIGESRLTQVRDSRYCTAILQLRALANGPVQLYSGMRY